VVALHAESAGQGSTLVLAHGFTQTGRLWGSFGDLVGSGRHVVAVDLPGHGGSDDVRADLVTGGTLLLEAGGAAPFDLLGYSLGARFALHAALAAPGRVTRLVLISGTAGIDDDNARAERAARDEGVAAGLEGEADVDAFIASWLATPMFATLRGKDAGTDERRRNTPAGLASSLRLAGAGVQTPLWDRLGELPMPVLVLAGSTDPRFAAHGQRLARLIPNAIFVVVPGAGHALQLEQPEVAASIVRAWLAASVPAES
jgi:2-succinyl-6-hydroxy-2,4-cyclohexadiene-1-carboxylate synthase